MSIKSPENTKFVKDFSAWIKAPKVTGVDFPVSGIDTKGRVTCSPMNLSRMGVYLWKQAVEKAGTFDVDKVRTRSSARSSRARPAKSPCRPIITS
jgi:urea transport system substrate-binding protein